MAGEQTYRSRSVVLAETAEGGEWVETRTGLRPARPGDFIVTHADGTREVRNPAEFAMSYELLPGQRVAPECEWPARDSMAVTDGDAEC